jgi:hypothetical protein
VPESVTIVGIFIATGNLKDALAQHLLIAMVGITRIASVIEGLDKTTNDTDVRFGLAKQQHPAVTAQCPPLEIPLKAFTAKSCKRQHHWHILDHGGFLAVVATSISGIAILKQWLVQGNRYFMNNPG